MRKRQSRRGSIRLAVMTAVATGTVLAGSMSAAPPAAADPVPPTPRGAVQAASIPSTFRIAPMGLGRVDDPAMGEYGRWP